MIKISIKNLNNKYLRMETLAMPTWFSDCTEHEQGCN
jgi:hypothetical protein